jgi:hypothetical protein
MTEITVLQIEIAKLELNRGDILFARIPVSFSPEQQKLAREAIDRAVRLAGVDVPVLVGTNDIEFQIVRKTQNEE